MRQLIRVLLLCAFIAATACGSQQESAEKAVDEKAMADSLVKDVKVAAGEIKKEVSDLKTEIDDLLGEEK